MQEKLARLKQLQAEIFDLAGAAALLDWDQQTYMPSGGAEDRGNALATVSRILHEKRTSAEMGKLLDELMGFADSLDPDSDEARLIKVSKREFGIDTKVPPAWMEEWNRLTSLAQNAWVAARKESDFSRFEPHLEKIVEMRWAYADFFAPYDHVYDPLLDIFEPGMKTSDVKAIFKALRPQQVALIEAISAQPQVDDSFLQQVFPQKAQWDFGMEVMTAFGFDWERGRQDISAHPMTTILGLGDVRMTTNFQENFFNKGILGSMHECGHGLYGQGDNPAYVGTMLGGGTSSAFHESQSRAYENLVGRSLPFWKHFYPRLQEYFPTQLGDVDLMTFYKGINKVEPSMIRIEADEATYNLHIMLRLELEIEMIEGAIAIRDLPGIWDSRMEEYLGITPKNDAEGVLQDIHWSSGLFGYFPTYALGNLVSVQLWEAMKKDLPDIEAQIERGEFTHLLGWMRENVHRHGRKYEPQELAERVTGSKIDPQPYIRYLQEKFSAIYGL